MSTHHVELTDEELEVAEVLRQCAEFGTEFDQVIESVADKLDAAAKQAKEEEAYAKLMVDSWKAQRGEVPNNDDEDTGPLHGPWDGQGSQR